MGIINVNNPVLNRTHFLTSPFGLRTLNGTRRMHNGIDLVGWNGESTCLANVLAFDNGKVIAEGYDTNKGYFIELKHSNCITVYYHLDGRATKQVGMQVKKGDILGMMGNSGNSTAAHLHFGLKETNWVDPLPYLEEEEMDYETFKTYMQKYEEEKSQVETPSEWAKEGIAWSQETGIINGDGNGHFMPKANVTREQLATILRRMSMK